MKKLLALSLAALLSGTAAAEGGYAGVDFGQGRLSDLSLKGSSWNVYGGYRLNESIGFELGYRRVLSDDMPVFTTKVKTTVAGLQASVLGYLPLGNDVSLFGRLGVNNLKVEASGPGGKASDSETKALVGLGLDYSFSKAVALRVEYQKPASDVSVLSAGLKFSF